MLAAVHKNPAQRVGEFRGHQHELGRLNDLYRERQVHHARNSGDVTDVERIFLDAVLEILFLLFGSRRRVGDFAVRRIHDDAAAGGHVEYRDVIFKIHRGCVQHLPNALQVRVSVDGTRRLIGLSGERYDSDQREY